MSVKHFIGAYGVWQIEIPTVTTVLHATQIQGRHRVSFWDAMIVATALSGGAEVLLSEDLSHGQVIEGVRVENPFLH
jgi:predicted nucleic acid-binding protein